jgi:hypothetical protein
LGEAAGDLALYDGEAFIARSREVSACHAVDPCGRRLILWQDLSESEEVFFGAFNFDVNAVGGVTDESVESKFGRQTIHKWAKADTLDNAPNTYFFSSWHLSLCLHT